MECVLILILVASWASGGQALRSQNARPGRWELKRGFSAEALAILEEFAAQALPRSLQDTLSSDGDMEDFINWLEAEKVSATHVLRFWDYRVKLNLAGVESAEINELEAWFVSRNELKLLEETLNVQIPMNIRHKFLQKDFNGFGDWLISQRIRLPRGRWNSAATILRGAGASTSVMARLESELVTSDYNNIQLTSQAIRDLELALGSRSIPFDVKRQMERGNFTAFSEWYSQSNARIEAEKWSQLQLKVSRSGGVSQTDIEMLNKWYSETTKGSVGSSSEWENVSLSSSAIAVLSQSFRKPIPSAIRLNLLRGEFRNFAEWTESEGIKLSAAEQSSLLRSLRGKTSQENIDRIETWLKETDGGGVPRGSGSVEKENWKDLRLEPSVISEMKNRLSFRFPFSVESEMRRGNFNAFHEWVLRENIEIDQSEWERFTRSQSASDATALNQWFEQFQKRKVSNKSDDVSLSARAVFQFRRFLRLRIPSDVQRRMKSDGFSAFSKWTLEENIELDEKAFRDLTAALKQGGDIEIEDEGVLNKWYNEEYRNRGTSVFTTVRPSNKGEEEWERINLSTGAMKKLESAFGAEIPSGVWRSLSGGDFKAFSEWILTQNTDLSEREFSSLKSALRSEGTSSRDLDALEGWFLKEYRGGKRSSGNWKSARLNIREMSTIGRQLRLRIPVNIQRSGNMEEFATWIKAEKTEISRSDFDSIIEALRRQRTSDATLESLQVWYNQEYGTSVGISTKRPEPSTKKPDPAKPNNIKLSKPQLQVIGRALGRKIPDSVIDTAAGGDFSAFSRWAEDNNVQISAYQLRVMEFNLKRQRLAPEELEKFKSWIENRGKNPGVTTTTVAPDKDAWKRLKFSYSNIRAFEDALGNEISYDVRQRMVNGDFEAFVNWLNDGNFNIPADKYQDLERELRRQGVSSADLETLAAWHKSFRGTTTSKGKSVSNSDIRTLGLLLNKRIPYNVQRDLDQGDYNSFIDWLSSEKVEINDLNVFPRSLPDEFMERIREYAGRSGGSTTGSGGGTISVRGIRSITTELLPRGKTIPISVQRSLESGDAVRFFAWMKEEQIHVSQESIAQLRRNSGSSDISNEFFTLLETYEGSQREMSLEAIDEVELLGGEPLPSQIISDLEKGNYLSYFNWLNDQDILFNPDDFDFFQDNYDQWGISEQFANGVRIYHESKSGGGGRRVDRGSEELIQRWRQFLDNRTPPSNLVEVRDNQVLIEDCIAFVDWLTLVQLRIRPDDWVWFADSYADLGVDDECFLDIRLWYWEYNLSYPPWLVSMLEYAEEEKEVEPETLDRLNIPFDRMDNSMDRILFYLGLTSNGKIQDFLRSKTG